MLILQMIFSILSFVVSVGIPILFVVVAVKVIRRRFYSQPRTIRATVMDKWQDTRTEFSMIKGYAIPKTEFVITFQAGDRVLRLDCGPGFYESLEKGDEGELTYQGGRVLDFKGEEPEE